jgi:hypothetical protein
MRMPDQDRNERSEHLEEKRLANQSADPSQQAHDPEFEIPDPEQVDQDRKRAEETYGSKQPASTESPKNTNKNVA